MANTNPFYSINDDLVNDPFYRNALERTDNNIGNANRNADDIEVIGQAVLGDLESQREKLTNVRDNLPDIDTNLEVTRRIIKRMERRRLIRKICCWTSIVLLLAALITILYFIWINPNSPDKTH